MFLTCFTHNRRSVIKQSQHIPCQLSDMFDELCTAYKNNVHCWVFLSKGSVSISDTKGASSFHPKKIKNKKFVKC